MRRNFLQITRYLVIATLLPMVVGCSVIRTAAGPAQTDTQTIESNGASSAQVELTLGAGELKLSSGASELAKAVFTYNVAGWKPNVKYSVSNDRGTLLITQPDTAVINLQGTRNEWDVQLNNAIPIDLKLNMGAGKAALDLRGLMLNAVDIAAGAGELQMDLSGAWGQSAAITIEGGVGKVTLRLPKAVGVRVEATAGLGRVNATGLSKDGDAYVNVAYGNSVVVLNITVKAGVGEVNLDME